MVTPAEVDYDKIEKPQGLQVTIVTSTKTKDKALRLLELLGMPFTKEEKVVLNTAKKGKGFKNG